MGRDAALDGDLFEGMQSTTLEWMDIGSGIGSGIVREIPREVGSPSHIATDIIRRATRHRKMKSTVREYARHLESPFPDAQEGSFMKDVQSPELNGSVSTLLTFVQL